MTFTEIVLAGFAVPQVAATGYLTLLAVLSRHDSVPAALPLHVRFEVVVPAHNEERNIEGTVASLLAVDYPHDLYRVVVVADNCSDATAARARAAGADVVERRSRDQRGKGYVLREAFTRILDEGRAEAVVVVDADTVVSSNLLRAFAARLDAGAAVVQADYGVANPNASWRTQLMTIALATVHTLRALARQRLRVSAGLHGNGMCFSVEALRAVPYGSFSIVEDLEYGIRLGEMGYPVRFAAEAQVYGEMPARERESRLQRQRWEAGRRHMVRRHAWRLLRRGIVQRDRVVLDLALELIVPPLATIVIVELIGLLVAGLLWWSTGTVTTAAWVWAGCGAGLAVYTLRGWWLSKTGLSGLVALAAAPGYVAWKLLLPLRHSAAGRGEWVRTPREGETR